MITNFANHLLIAMPSLIEPSFKRSVIYLCEHSEEGAMGVVLNIPIEMNLAEMVEQAAPESEVISQKANQPIIKGGACES